MTGLKIDQGLPFDARLGVVARRSGLSRAEAIALYLLLVDTASRDGGGSIKSLDPESAAVVLEMDAKKTEAAMTAMRDKGLVDDAGCISGWKQAAASSTARVRAWRKKRQEREARRDPDDPASIARRHARLDIAPPQKIQEKRNDHRA